LRKEKGGCPGRVIGEKSENLGLQGSGRGNFIGGRGAAEVHPSKALIQGRPIYKEYLKGGGGLDISRGEKEETVLS